MHPMQNTSSRCSRRPAVFFHPLRFFFPCRLLPVLLLCAALLPTACSVLKPRPGGPADNAAGKARRGPAPAYLDFADILVPEELKMNRKHSYVFETPGLTAGVLALRGRVTADSLIRFFEANMTKDNWRPAGSFQSPRSLLMFEKGNRWCVITISAENMDLYTHVEIWVVPRAVVVGSGLLK